MRNAINTINKAWDVLADAKKNHKASNERNINVLKQLVDQLHGLSCNDYPKYGFYLTENFTPRISFNSNQVTVTNGNLVKIRFRYGMHHTDEINTDQFMRLLNLLLWAVSTHAENTADQKFGLFMSEWNFAKTLEKDGLPDELRNSLDTYASKNGVDLDQYQSNPFSQHEDSPISTLRQIARAIECYPNANEAVYQQSTLESIANGTWTVDNKKLAKGIIKHAHLIAKHGTKSEAVKSVLARHHVITGQNLMERLVAEISYNKNFNEDHKLGIAISKIADPSTMYIYHKNDPWSVKPANADYIKKTMTDSLHAKKHLQEAIAKRNKIEARFNKRIANLKNSLY